jgi:hypothetical protein
MSFYLNSSGYGIGSVGIGAVGATDDFYNPGFSQDRFEEELAENEMRRRMMMESARDLEVDLGNVGIDDQPEVSHSRLRCKTLTDVPSHQRSLRKNSKNLIGQDVCTTRCLFSRRTTWIASSILSLRT